MHFTLQGASGEKYPNTILFVIIRVMMSQISSVKSLYPINLFKFDIFCLKKSTVSFWQSFANISHLHRRLCCMMPQTNETSTPGLLCQQQYNRISRKLLLFQLRHVLFITRHARKVTLCRTQSWERFQSQATKWKTGRWWLLFILCFHFTSLF